MQRPAGNSIIIEVREESPQVKSFFFEYSKDAEPGQFLMCRVPAVGEIPLSVSFYDGSVMSVSVRKVGSVTRAFHKLRAGDYIGVRGPYGSSFKLRGDQVALVAGGCGAAALVYLAEAAARENKKVHAFVGAANAKEILFKDRFEAAGDLHIVTDDGSAGRKGFVTEMMEAILEKEEIDAVYTCGPEVMMKKVAEFCFKHKIAVQASLERYMKCGLGICGSCTINGMRVCKDGAVFDGGILKGLKEFGSFERDACGTKVKI